MPLPVQKPNRPSPRNSRRKGGAQKGIFQKSWSSEVYNKENKSTPNSLRLQALTCQILAKAFFRSSTKSSASSIPTLSRISVSVSPTFRRLARGGCCRGAEWLRPRGVFPVLVGLFCEKSYPLRYQCFIGCLPVGFEKRTFYQLSSFRQPFCKFFIHCIDLFFI